MNESKSLSIVDLSTEITNNSRNILRRIGSLADALGGSIPSVEDTNNPNPADLHSALQRTLTILRLAQDELQRCEKVTGVSDKNCPIASAASVGSMQTRNSY